MASLFDWSSTASANTSCDGINCNTGMSPANTDNLFRSLMALVRNSFSSALQSFLAGLSALPIANGGTAATDAATALSNLGGLSSTYRDLPIASKSSAFTFADSERGGGIFFFGASAADATINPQSSTAITVGAVYVIRVGGAGTLTVKRGSGVYLSVNGAGPSADAVMAPGAVGTLINWGGDIWTISGPGVS